MKKRVVIGGALLAAVALSIGWASASTVQSEIRDYQKRGACYRADLNFDRTVNDVDTKMIQDWFGRSDAPTWYDQDRDGIISIIDIATVGGQYGRTC